MPTWPSGSKASTTNVDEGSDSISLARADIKQNIDNVNTIIDTFNISTPSNGDLLQYSSTSGKWEQIESSTIGRFSIYFKIHSTTRQNAQSGRYRRLIQYILDPTNTTTTTGDSAGQSGGDSAGDYTDIFVFDLPAGTYILSSAEAAYAEASATYFLWNEDADVDVVQMTSTTFGTGNPNVYPFAQQFTLSSTTTLSFQTATTANPGNQLLFKITKYS